MIRQIIACPGVGCLSEEFQSICMLGTSITAKFITIILFSWAGIQNLITVAVTVLFSGTNSMLYFFLRNSWSKQIFCANFPLPFPSPLPCYPGKFIIQLIYIAITVLVTAKYSRNLICNGCSWDGIISPQIMAQQVISGCVRGLSRTTHSWIA